MGQFFDAEIGESRSCGDESNVTILFNKITKLLQTNTHKKMLSTFTKDMVSIKTDGKEVFGSVKCVYCMEYKQIYFDETYFIVSNMNRHLNSCAKTYEKKTEKPSSKNKEKIILNPEENTANQLENIVDQDGDIVDPQSVQFDENTDTTPEQKDNSIIVSLQIEKLSDSEQYINDQIIKQIGIMEKISLKNKESEINMNVVIETGTPSQIRCALITADGNCLVAALAHQIFHHPLRSAQHIDAIRSLKETAFEYMKKNIGIFRTLISLRNDFEKVTKGIKKDKKIETFIDKLVESGIWAGTETLVAVSRLFSVNIIIIHEGGSCSMPQKFNLDYKFCVILAYCKYATTAQKNGNSKNHYNSVTNMNSLTISSCMKKISNFLNPSTIEID